MPSSTVRSSPDAALPSVAIVVPTKDRHEPLARCVASLARLDYPRDRFQVLIVDDGGSAPLPARIHTIDRDLDLRAVAQSGRGPAAARNAGAEATQATLLAFTDDDCVVDPAWMGKLVEAHLADRDALIGGRIENNHPENPFSAASHDLIEFLYEEYYPGAPRFFCSNNLAVPRDRFLDHGGFDASFPDAAGEDRDFCDRWRHAGGVLHYQRSAVVKHDLRLGPRSFWSQHCRYGRAAALYWDLHADRWGTVPRREPPSFYLRMFAYPAARASIRRALPRSALLVLSQVANAVAFGRERKRMRIRTPSDERTRRSAMPAGPADSSSGPRASLAAGRRRSL